MSETGENNPEKKENPAQETANQAQEKPPEKAAQSAAKDSPFLNLNKLELFHDLPISISIEVGRAKMKIKDLLTLSKGSIIELDKLAGDPVDIYANGKLISTGNIISANGKYCVKLLSINEDHAGSDDVKS